MAALRLASRASVLAAALVLSACVSLPPPYVPPADDGPTAQLRTAVSLSGRDSAEYWMKFGGGPKGWFRVFNQSGAKTNPEGYVNIRANESVQLTYTETASNGQVCQIKSTFRLEAGKRYTLGGGTQFSSGPIPILTTRRSCELSLKEDGTGQAVPMTPRRF